MGSQDEIKFLKKKVLRQTNVKLEIDFSDNLQISLFVFDGESKLQEDKTKRPINVSSFLVSPKWYPIGFFRNNKNHGKRILLAMLEILELCQTVQILNSFYLLVLSKQKQRIEKWVLTLDYPRVVAHRPNQFKLLFWVTAGSRLFK